MSGPWRFGAPTAAVAEEEHDEPVGLVMDPCFEEHLTGPGHPERPERLARGSELRWSARGLAAPLRSGPRGSGRRRTARPGPRRGARSRAWRQACAPGQDDRRLHGHGDLPGQRPDRTTGRRARWSALCRRRGAGRLVARVRRRRGRRATTPSGTWPWASACSTAWPSRRGH